MTLDTATFELKDHKVIFLRSVIAAYDTTGKLLHSQRNKWVSSGAENPNTVMGREFKPRVTDAKRFLKLALEVNSDSSAPEPTVDIELTVFRPETTEVA